MERHDDLRPRRAPAGALLGISYVCFGVGVVLMLAMSFGLLRHDLALFLGTSAFVIGGLIWGYADARGGGPDGSTAGRPGDGGGPTVSRRQP